MTHEHAPARSNFRRFFFRGLAILLPSVLTIWIIIAAYGFIQTRIAEPINRGVRELVILVTPWPPVYESEIEARREIVEGDREQFAAWQAAGGGRDWLRTDARRSKLWSQWWKPYRFPLDLIGLVIAIILIYMAGRFLGSFIGARIFARGEELLRRVPLVKQVYPSVKQVTDFLVGGSDDQKMSFNRVVAVEYPRKGLWSIGLVTGSTMQSIQDRTGRACMTIFVPSSPTPFTGYVIIVPREDTIDLSVTIEEALRFTISGGVVIPPSQQIPDPDRSAVSAVSNGAAKDQVRV